MSHTRSHKCRPPSISQVSPRALAVSSEQRQEAGLGDEGLGSLGFHGNNIWASLRDKRVRMLQLSKGPRGDIQGSCVHPGLVPAFLDGQWRGKECEGLRGCREM